MVKVQYGGTECRVAHHTGRCEQVANYLADELHLPADSILVVGPEDDCHWKIEHLSHVATYLRQHGYDKVNVAGFLTAPNCPHGHLN